MNLKIRDKIIGIMVVLIVLPILLLGGTSYKTSSKALKSQYEELGTIIADEANLLIKEEIDETNKLLTLLASEPGLYNIEENNLNSVMNQLKSSVDVYEFINVYYTTREGKVYMTASGDVSHVVPQERPWYVKAIESEHVAWSEVYEDAITGDYIITASKAVYDGGVLKGVNGGTSRRD